MVFYHGLHVSKHHGIYHGIQGDSLSPVLVVVYLEAALQTLRRCVPRRPPADHNLPSEAMYATDHEYLSKVNEIVPTALGDWFLHVNVDKTERTIISRGTDSVAEEWRTTTKLGSLLGNVEDLSRRNMLAVNAFRSMWSL